MPRDNIRLAADSRAQLFPNFEVPLRDEVGEDAVVRRVQFYEIEIGIEMLLSFAPLRNPGTLRPGGSA